MQVRKGVLPRLLEEILSTRIMVKQAMKKLTPSQRVLHRVKITPPFAFVFALLELQVIYIYICIYINPESAITCLL